MNSPMYGTRNWAERNIAAALFRSEDDAQNAINELKDRGFSSDQIGVAMRDRDAEGRLAEDTGTHAASGAVSGAVAGGLVGGALGLAMGLGALIIPGIGPAVAGGILASTLGVAGGTAAAGAGIGAVAGGLVGALIGAGIPKHEAEYFEEGFKRGEVLVTVNAGQRSFEAADILQAHGGDTGSSLYEPAQTGSF